VSKEREVTHIMRSCDPSNPNRYAVYLADYKVVLLTAEYLDRWCPGWEACLVEVGDPELCEVCGTDIRARVAFYSRAGVWLCGSCYPTRCPLFHHPI
jgi:hypothetical protein